MEKANPASDQLRQQLLRYLLLGTDQVSLAQQWPALLDQYGISGDTEASQLLELSAKVQLLSKGARTLPRWAAPLATPPPSPTGTPCSWRTVQHLQLILSGHHSRALAEFIRLLQEHEKRLPSDSIPPLLDQCLQTPALWELLRPLLSEAEFWLIRQHPHWSRLLPAPASFDHWPELPAKEQLEALQAYRQTAPEAARDSLSDHWLNLDHRAQARVLPALATKLSTADEAFLEHCLQASRKNIRQAASELLCQLPDSALVEKISALAATAISMGKQAVQIDAGDDLPNTIKTYGIDPTGSKLPGGLQLNAVLQLIARTPFSRWTKHWKMSAAEVVRAFANNERGLLLLQALNESLLRLPEEEGQEALIKWWLLSGQETLWNNKNAKALLATASPAFFNASLLQWLEQFGPLVPADTLPAYWLSTGEQPWQAALSKIVVLGFQDVIQGRRTANWHLWHYKSIFEAAGYNSSPELLDQFRTGWSFRNNSFGRWHGDLEKMLQTLHFRKEMQAGIAQ